MVVYPLTKTSFLLSSKIADDGADYYTNVFYDCEDETYTKGDK